MDSILLAHVNISVTDRSLSGLTDLSTADSAPCLGLSLLFGLRLGMDYGLDWNCNCYGVSGVCVCVTVCVCVLLHNFTEAQSSQKLPSFLGCDS